LQPVQRRTLADQVADEILQYIRLRGLRRGDRLPPEPELVRLLHVGRSSVREGMQRLVSLGVVQVRQGSGTTVLRPPAGIEGAGSLLDRLARKRVSDLFEARLMLEPVIAATVAERGTDEDFAELEAVVARLRQAADQGTPVYATAADFHRVLATATGNQVFERMVDSFFDVLIDHGVELDGQPEHKEWEWRIHRDLLAVLRRRDPDLARQKMLEHLHESFESLDRIIPR